MPRNTPTRGKLLDRFYYAASYFRAAKQTLAGAERRMEAAWKAVNEHDWKVSRRKK